MKKFLNKVVPTLIKFVPVCAALMLVINSNSTSTSFNGQAKPPKALKKYQEEPSPEEDLKKIPMLEISDIDPEPRTIKSQIREINGIPTVYYDCFTNGIGYAILSFDCKNIPTELLPYIGLQKKA